MKTPISPIPCCNLSYGQPRRLSEIEALSQQVKRWIQHQGLLPLSRSELEALKARYDYLKQLSEKEITQDDRIRLILELSVTEIRLDKSPQGIKRQRKAANKDARDTRAGRKRNNKKAAKRLVERFQQDLLWRLENGRTPQKAYQEAMAYVEKYLHEESRAKDKHAVFSLFRDLLGKDQ